ncbi:MAG TPA: glycine oxidase ThiO [Solirubrobacterales bacterium]|nr:glycine oxidase ThiO [Solirubrobacterales bacterium]
MSEQRGFDAIFVGGGVIGLSCAWRAAQRGARVAVLERAEPPAGATNVAAGMLAPVGELSFGEPQLLELTLESAKLYPEFVAELEAAGGEATGYRQQGALHLALDGDEAAQLRRRHDLQLSLGLEAEWLAPRRCRELEPGLTPSFYGGVLAAGEASIDPRALARALQAALAAAGAEVRTGTEVVDGVWEGERLTGVRTAGGEELHADAIVLATGAWSGQTAWLPEADRPPVRPVKGEVLELRNRDGSPPCGRILASERVYLVPRPDGRLIVGATSEEQGFDISVTAGGVHELLREAYRLLPDVAEMELVATIAGLRPGTPDNLPIVGPGAVEGLILATGHYRNGILLAPLTANRIADLIASGRSDGLLSSFPTHSDAKDDSKDEPRDRAAELAARGAALVAAAEAAERAGEVRR